MKILKLRKYLNFENIETMKISPLKFYHWKKTLGVCSKAVQIETNNKIQEIVLEIQVKDCPANLYSDPIFQF